MKRIPVQFQLKAPQLDARGYFKRVRRRLIAKFEVVASCNSSIEESVQLRRLGGSHAAKSRSSYMQHSVTAFGLRGCAAWSCAEEPGVWPYKL